VAEEMGLENRVHVIDSENLSTGIGHMAIQSAILADEGRSITEILTEIDRMKPLVRVSFVIDTMTYLHRGGRCGGMTALVAGSLKMHPCIEVADGAMHVGKKYRGKMDTVIRNFFNDHIENCKKAWPDRVFISHARCEEALVESLRQQLVDLGHFKEVHVTSVGCVVASHCGPGTLGLVYVDE
ncbi:MAG: DegV family EDD domain-containing protein, partial [Lachnospiraceae bacterium]|nr:DegV family EDD domain-containing protein [Lachnospiraceae bacterium]